MGQLARLSFRRLVPEVTLFHATEHLLLPLRRVPTVLTVHDLIFRHLPQHHKSLNRWYLNATMPLYCRHADQIIAISQATRQDLMAAYGVPAEKITVIPEAADPQFHPQSPETVTIVRARYDLPQRYLLFVGTIEPRKNLGRLLTAFEVLQADGLTDGLVIVGRRGWLTDAFFAQLERSPARDAVIFPGYVPDPDLPAIYAGAQALVFPSLYEGFGLPVLEAMACETPVVTSRTSSIPEVGGDAALYFDPEDADEILAQIRRVLSDPALSAELRSQGLAQADRFSWARTAAQTQSVYNSILQP
jgi:glycosyltransferase involved in cell wall biosynthesis